MPHIPIPICSFFPSFIALRITSRGRLITSVLLFCGSLVASRLIMSAFVSNVFTRWSTLFVMCERFPGGVYKHDDTFLRHSDWSLHVTTLLWWLHKTLLFDVNDVWCLRCHQNDVLTTMYPLFVKAEYHTVLGLGSLRITFVLGG